MQICEAKKRQAKFEAEDARRLRDEARRLQEQATILDISNKWLEKGLNLVKNQESCFWMSASSSLGARLLAGGTPFFGLIGLPFSSFLIAFLWSLEQTNSTISWPDPILLNPRSSSTGTDFEIVSTEKEAESSPRDFSILPL